MPVLPPFRLERYFARYEFSAPYSLSSSDCESLRQEELLAIADPETAGLWSQLGLGYTESAGHPLLRKEIAGLYTNINPNQTLVLAPEEGVFIAMTALLGPEDEVVAIQPAYQSLHEIARWIGCRLIAWPLIPIQHGWRIDLDRLESSLGPRTRMLVLNFPHNPTGYQPSRAELDSILELANRRELYVFSDEMYRLLEYDPSQRLPAACDQYERAVSLSGLSKAFGCPGLRIGWLATRAPGLIERFQVLRDYTTICSSAPSEILALIALRAREGILQRNRAIVRDNLEAAGNFFARHPGSFEWLPPQAGSVAFPRWLGDGSLENFCTAAVERQGVMIAPGSLFDFPGGYFRIGLGRKNLPEALQRVERLLT